MSQVLTPTLICAERTKIQRTRELPVTGRILKKVGEEVKASEAVARAELPGDLEIIRMAGILGLEPSEVEARLKIRVKDAVKKGDLLAEDSALWGLLKSVVVSPVDGTVDFFTHSTGNLGIRLHSNPVELSGYLSGRVTHVKEGKSVTIEAVGTLIQGIFGVGGERLGRLACLKVSPDTMLAPEHIPQECKGLVLVGGMHPSLAALKCAADRGAVGLVTGSIDDIALKSYVGYDVGVAVTGDEDITMSVIVTEGFGQIPISQRAWMLLSNKEGREVSLNGTTQVRAGAVRPEIIISDNGAVADDPKDFAKGLGVGARVRLIRYPYFGKFAEVVELPHEPRKIDSGAMARVLMARMEDGGAVVCVPRANVELVG